MKRIIVILLFATLGCNVVPRKVTMNDPQVQTLLKAAAVFDRDVYGFTPIPKTANARLELARGKTYDVMLHIDSPPTRTIAFRKEGDRYRWIGEQEIFEGKKQYTTLDGTFYEQICLNYDTEHISGFPLNQVAIAYSGEDPRFAYPKNLTLSDIRPILKEWGY